VPAGETGFMQALAVDCLLSRRGGLTLPRECSMKQEFFFLHDQRWNVYENKGPLWKKWGSSGNVYENKGIYVLRAGIYLKTRELMFS
jgi:hypothetical protein